MSASVLTRLVCNLLVFILIARLLGVASFGHFMTAFAAASISGLLINYGLSAYTLREISHGATAGPIVAQVISARLLICIAVLAIYGLSALVLPDWLLGLLGLLLVAQILESFADVFWTALRADALFRAEAIATSAASVVHLACCFSALALGADGLGIAATFVLSRGAALAFAVLIWCKEGFAFSEQISMRNGATLLRTTRAYAVDSSLSGMFGLVDSVVLAHFLGPSAVGLHQAGMRIFLGASQAATVLGNVYLPSIGRAAKGGDTAPVRQSQLAFHICGFLGALVFIATPRGTASFLFGADFQDLDRLWPFFGLLFAARFQASAWGLLLTSQGAQTSRSAWIAAHWTLVFSLAFFLVPTYGIKGWIGALISGTFILGCGYYKSLLNAIEPPLNRSDIRLVPTLTTLLILLLFAGLDHGF